MASCSLSKSQIHRYSRQLLLPEFGPAGQERLCRSSVLIVGAGGLGCPAGQYLAGAGIGRLTFVDYDSVDLTNLHRQVLHTEDRVGVSKAESACTAIRALNSTIECRPYSAKLSAENAVDIVKQHDIVIDASDNAVTRYLINDACVKAGKALISGAALRWDGQLTTYNWQTGPCYRCLFPKPPPAAAITNCDAGGVMGAVTGIVGSLQALEAIRILSGAQSLYSGKLLIFNGMTGEFRTMKLRGRRPDCCCSDPSSLIIADNYEQFCGASATDKTPSVDILDPSERISCREFNEQHKDTALLIDVRPPDQYAICSLPGSINVPLAELEHRAHEISGLMDGDRSRPLFAMCRRGIQSQHAVRKLKALGFSNVRDLVGGITAWSHEVDPDVPMY